MSNDINTLEDRAEFNVYLLWADTAEEAELPDDYAGGEWSASPEVDLMPEAPRCSVHLRATYAGLSGESNALGCSYASEEEFMESAMYMPMKLAARFDLEEKVKAQRLKLAELAAGRGAGVKKGRECKSL